MKRRKTRRRRHGFLYFLTIIYMIFLALCSWSSSSDGIGGAKGGSAINAITSIGKVTLANGAFDKDTEELTVVLEKGETALLGQFENLKHADFSGSACLDEITEWAAGHFGIGVSYTVPVPGGEPVANDATTVDLSGAGNDEIADFAAQLRYLPKVKEINLGRAETVSAVLSTETIDAVKEAAPDAELSYSVLFLGNEYTMDTDSLDLSALEAGEVQDAAALMGCLPELTNVTLGENESLSWDDIGTLQSAAPGADFDYSFSLFGKSVNLMDEVLDLNHIKMDDEGAAVREVLPYMTALKTLDMDYCEVSNEAMAGIRADFPEVDVIWRIWFGDVMPGVSINNRGVYSVRTDETRVLASKSSVAGMLTAENIQNLKYCTKVKYLDLGHSETLNDISFVADMTDLEVFVIAMAPITDLSPLQNCSHLEYFEVFTTQITDLSPLADKQELRHLNIGNNPQLKDISPLYGLTNLERLWIGKITQIPEDQIASMRAAAPGCEVNLDCDTAESGPIGRWRYYYLQTADWDIYHYVKRYSLLNYQMGYRDNQFSFYWMDPLCGDEAPAGYGNYRHMPQEEWQCLGYDEGNGVMKFIVNWTEELKGESTT